MVEYTTEQGIILRVGRLQRQKLDAVQAGAEPIPPEVLSSSLGREVWGDPEAKEYDHRDPGYLEELHRWQQEIGERQTALIVGAIGLDDEAQANVTELHRLGIVPDTSLLTFFEACLTEQEQNAVVGLVLYQSTVTTRGIVEADAAFAVTWRSKPVSAWSVPGMPVRQGRQFEDRTAAILSGYKWSEFCELHGAEQSKEVTFHRIARRLEWLILKHK